MASIDLYLMSPPGPRWVPPGRGHARAAEVPPVDPQAALAEWIALADAIEVRGGRVVCLVPPEDTALMGLPLTAECGQIVARAANKPLFLVPAMHLEVRREERELWKPAVESMGLLPCTLRRTWEGQSDLAFFRSRTLMFYGGRTTRDGALEVAERLATSVGEPLYLEIREPASHGSMAVLPLGPVDRLLVCPDLLVGKSLSRLESAFGKERLLSVSVEEVRGQATGGLSIGRDVLAAHLTPPRVQALLHSLGLNVVLLSMVELGEKAGRAARNLVSYARVDNQLIQIPATLDYRLRRSELLGRLPAPLRRQLE